LLRPEYHWPSSLTVACSTTRVCPCKRRPLWAQIVTDVFVRYAKRTFPYWKLLFLSSIFKTAVAQKLCGGFFPAVNASLEVRLPLPLPVTRHLSHDLAAKYCNVAVAEESTPKCCYQGVNQKFILGVREVPPSLPFLSFLSFCPFLSFPFLSPVSKGPLNSS